MLVYFSFLKHYYKFFFFCQNMEDTVVIVERCETELCVLLPSVSSICRSLNHILPDEPQLLWAFVYFDVRAFSSFSIRNWNFSVRSLILAAVCISIAVVWGVYRNEDRYCFGTHAHKTHNCNPVCFSQSHTPRLRQVRNTEKEQEVFLS